MADFLETDACLEGLVTCSICEDIYKEPQALTCLHTLCKQCLQNMREASKDNRGIHCPSCRKYSTFRQIQKDFRTQTLVDHYESVMALKEGEFSSVKIACGLCSAKRVMYRCEQCEANLCEQCQISHTKIPELKAHSCVTISSIVDRKVEELQRVREEVQESHDKAKDLKMALDTSIATLKQREETTCSQIDTNSANMHDMITQHCDGLKHELREMISEQSKPLVKQALQVKDLQEQAKTNLTQVDDLLQRKDSEKISQLNPASLKVTVPQQLDSASASPEIGTTVNLNHFQDALKSSVCLKLPEKPRTINCLPNSSKQSYAQECVTQCYPDCHSLTLIRMGDTFQIYCGGEKQHRVYSASDGRLLNTVNQSKIWALTQHTKVIKAKVKQPIGGNDWCRMWLNVVWYISANGICGNALNLEKATEKVMVKGDYVDISLGDRGKYMYTLSNTGRIAKFKIVDETSYTFVFDQFIEQFESGKRTDSLQVVGENYLCYARTSQHQIHVYSVASKSVEKIRVISFLQDYALNNPRLKGSTDKEVLVLLENQNGNDFVLIDPRKASLSLIMDLKDNAGRVCINSAIIDVCYDDRSKTMWTLEKREERSANKDEHAAHIVLKKHKREWSIRQILTDYLFSH